MFLSLLSLPTAGSAVPLDDVIGAKTAGAGAGSASSVFGASGTPLFERYAVPNTGAIGPGNSGEPTIGIYWDPDGPDPVYFKTLWGVGQAVFDDSVVPPTVAWSDVSRSLETASGVFADPILHTDEETGRTWAGHFRFPTMCADIAYRDVDGSNPDLDLAGWTTSPLVCQMSAGDHETVGSGPWASGDVPSDALYPRAVYYCAQYPAVNGCSVSYDGGLTFPQMGTTAISDLSCLGLFGHIRISADGYAAVPHKSCGSNAGFSLSQDNGLTWSARTVPGTGTRAHFDPSVSFSRNPDADGNTWTYFGIALPGKAVVAASPDYGMTWSNNGAVDVSGFYTGPNGEKITRAEFADVQAGDADRAAISFLGSTDTLGGNHNGCVNNPAQDAIVWHYYVGYTFDGGATWEVYRASDDPVQIGPIYDGGFGTGDDSCRNLLDFNDMDIDSEGRVHIGYADGCPDGCMTQGASRSNDGAIIRQFTGRGLFAAFDQEVEPAATLKITSPAEGSDVDAGPVDILGTVHLKEGGIDLVANAGGPYAAAVDTPIPIIGTAFGGQSAEGFTCAWSGADAVFDNDGACSTTVAFDATGDKIITLTVNDGSGSATDDAGITVSDAVLPVPDDTLSGSLYAYNIDGACIGISNVAALATDAAGDPVPKYPGGTDVCISARSIGAGVCPYIGLDGGLALFDSSANQVYIEAGVPVAQDTDPTGANTGCRISGSAMTLPLEEGRYYLGGYIDLPAGRAWVKDSSGDPSGHKPLDIIGVPALLVGPSATQTVSFGTPQSNHFYTEESSFGIGFNPSHTFTHTLDPGTTYDITVTLDWSDASAGATDLDLYVTGAADSAIDGATQAQPESVSFTNVPPGTLNLEVEPYLVVDALDGVTYTLTAEITPRSSPAADSDGDGVPDTADVCPGFDDALDGDADGIPDGCDDDDDADGVPDIQDACPNAPGAGLDGCALLGMEHVLLTGPFTLVSVTDLAGGDWGGTVDLTGQEGPVNVLATWIDIAGLPLASASVTLNVIPEEVVEPPVVVPADDDYDDDGVLNADDNCLKNPNPAQTDLDKDGLGDACDEDVDSDAIENFLDNCPFRSNEEQDDLDGDGTGDACTLDIDGDGREDDVDNCLETPNPRQADLDGDGLGDACDADVDGDGFSDRVDNCPELKNPTQKDLDGDGLGDLCDGDVDGDGVPDIVDAFPMDPKESSDFDFDGIGDNAEARTARHEVVQSVEPVEEPKDKQSPGLGFMALVVALGAALLARRR